MNISFNWLSDYIQHGLSPDDLADTLTMCGLEVESVDPIGLSLGGVIVGEVLSTEPHPNADRLTLCRVDIGTDEPLSIVCGAPNVASGQHVPVACAGAALSLPSKEKPGERTMVTLRKSKIRGEVSEGMICAEDELGLSDDHFGIMILDTDAPVGTPFSGWLASKGLSASDSVLDIAITPNRPDAISHYGVARDLGALTPGTATLPDVDIPQPGGEATERISVTIEAEKACHRYAAMLVEGLTVSESPAWLKQKLSAVGMRPRNNLVDVTNFVMLECGQPLHAFDFDEIKSGGIVVRKTSKSGPFTTLDDRERELPAGTLMICDGDREVAIAGVMGGQNSEVTDTTTNVLIESAWFEPSLVRRTAKALGLQTDAGYRFERGIDPCMQAWAAARAAHLMAELGGGTVVDGLIDVHPQPHKPVLVRVRASRVRKVIGADVSPARMEELLRAIGYELDVDGEHDGLPVWQATVPSFQRDVLREIDIVEEVARLDGFDGIPLPTHSRIPNFTPEVRPVRALRERTQDLLAGAGFREIITNSMLSGEVASSYLARELPAGAFGGDIVETLNPITRDMSALRSSLLPGMMKVVGHNQNHGQRGVRLFEIGRVHTKTKTSYTIVGDYTEIETLLIAISGEVESATWYGETRMADVFDIRGILDRLFNAIHMNDIRYEPGNGGDVTEYALEILAGNDVVGVLGRTNDKEEGAFDLRSGLFFAELNWSAICRRCADRGPETFRDIPRFPVVDRDIAVVVSAEQHAAPLLDAIREAGGDLLNEAYIFDLYEGDRIDEGMKSIAFGLRFGTNRTLRDKEVDQVVSKILEALESGFGAKLR